MIGHDRNNRKSFQAVFYQKINNGVSILTDPIEQQSLNASSHSRKNCLSLKFVSLKIDTNPLLIRIKEEKE